MNEFPRRIQMQKWIPAEHAIYDAMQAVEIVGADLMLTDALILLGKAKDKVADYVDAHPEICSASPAMQPNENGIQYCRCGCTKQSHCLMNTGPCKACKCQGFVRLSASQATP